MPVRIGTDPQGNPIYAPDYVTEFSGGSNPVVTHQATAPRPAQAVPTNIPPAWRDNPQGYQEYLQGGVRAQVLREMANADIRQAEIQSRIQRETGSARDIIPGSGGRLAGSGIYQGKAVPSVTAAYRREHPPLPVVNVPQQSNRYGPPGSGIITYTPLPGYVPPEVEPAPMPTGGIPETPAPGGGSLLEQILGGPTTSSGDHYISGGGSPIVSPISEPVTSPISPAGMPAEPFTIPNPLTQIIQSAGQFFQSAPVLSFFYDAGAFTVQSAQLQEQTAKLEQLTAEMEASGILQGGEFHGTQEQFGNYIAAINRIEVLQKQIQESPANIPVRFEELQTNISKTITPYLPTEKEYQAIRDNPWITYIAPGVMQLDMITRPSRVILDNFPKALHFGEVGFNAALIGLNVLTQKPSVSVIYGGTGETQIKEMPGGGVVATPSIFVPPGPLEQELLKFSSINFDFSTWGARTDDQILTPYGFLPYFSNILGNKIFISEGITPVGLAGFAFPQLGLAYSGLNTGLPLSDVVMHESLHITSPFGFLLDPVERTTRQITRMIGGDVSQNVHNVNLYFDALTNLTRVPQLPLLPRLRSQEGIKIPSFSSFLTELSIGQIEGLKERPLEAAAWFAVTAALPAIGSGVGRLAKWGPLGKFGESAIGRYIIGEIPVSKQLLPGIITGEPAGKMMINPLISTAEIVLGTLWAQSVVERVSGGAITPRFQYGPGVPLVGIDSSKFPTIEESARILGGIMSVEIAPAALGTIAGGAIWERAAGLWRSRGATEINIKPVELRVPSDFLTFEVDLKVNREAFNKIQSVISPPTARLTKLETEFYNRARGSPVELGEIHHKGNVIWRGAGDEGAIKFPDWWNKKTFDVYLHSHPGREWINAFPSGTDLASLIIAGARREVIVMPDINSAMTIRTTHLLKSKPLDVRVAAGDVLQQAWDAQFDPIWSRGIFRGNERKLWNYLKGISSETPVFRYTSLYDVTPSGIGKIRSETFNTLSQYEDVRISTKRLNDWYNSLTSKLTKIGSEIPGGIGYIEGYPVNKMQTVEKLLASFEEGTLYPRPHHLQGAGETFAVKYVPTRARLPNEIPGSFYGWTGWETDPGKLGTVFTLGPGKTPKGVHGMYQSPIAEFYFSKVNALDLGEYQLIGMGFPRVNTPTMLRTKVRGMEPLPHEVSAWEYPEINKWILGEGDYGISYLPMKKMEYEAVLPTFTPEGQTRIAVTGRNYYARVSGVRVPIVEMELTTPLAWAETGFTPETVFGGEIGYLPRGEWNRAQIELLSNLHGADRMAAENLFLIGQNIEGLRIPMGGPLRFEYVKSIGPEYAAKVEAILQNYPHIIYGSAARTGQMPIPRIRETYGKLPGDIDVRSPSFEAMAKDLVKIWGEEGRLNYIKSTEGKGIFGIEVQRKIGGEWVTAIDVHPMRSTMPENPIGWIPTNIHYGKISYERLSDQIMRNAYGSLLGREYSGKFAFGPKRHRVEKDVLGFYGDIQWLLESQGRISPEMRIVAESMRDLRQHWLIGKQLGGKRYYFGPGKEDYFSGAPLSYSSENANRVLINPTALGFVQGIVKTLKGVSVLEEDYRIPDFVQELSPVIRQPRQYAETSYSISEESVSGVSDISQNTAREVSRIVEESSDKPVSGVSGGSYATPEVYQRHYHSDYSKDISRPNSDISLNISRISRNISRISGMSGGISGISGIISGFSNGISGISGGISGVSIPHGGISRPPSGVSGISPPHYYISKFYQDISRYSIDISRISRTRSPPKTPPITPPLTPPPTTIVPVIKRPIPEELEWLWKWFPRKKKRTPHVAWDITNVVPDMESVFGVKWAGLGHDYGPAVPELVKVDVWKDAFGKSSKAGSMGIRYKKPTRKTLKEQMEEQRKMLRSWQRFTK